MAEDLQAKSKSEDQKDIVKLHESFTAIFLSVSRLLTVAVESFGWSGALLLFGFGFVVWYATPEQKHRIIDLYVLGEGISNSWALVVIGAVFVLTALAQYRWYLKKLRIVRNELERVGKEKSKLQEKKLKKSLQHADSKARMRGK